MLPVFYILKNCKINKNLIRVLPFFTFHKLTPFVSLYSILSVFYLLITLIISPVFPTFYTNSYPSFFPTYANSNFCLPYFIFFFHHTICFSYPFPLCICSYTLFTNSRTVLQLFPLPLSPLLVHTDSTVPIHTSDLITFSVYYRLQSPTTFLLILLSSQFFLSFVC